MGYGSVGNIFNDEFYALIPFIFQGLVTDLLFTVKCASVSSNSATFFFSHKNTNNQVYLNLIYWIGEIVMLFSF